MGAGASTRHAGFVEPESYKEHGTAEAAAREKVRKRSILAPCLRCKLAASGAVSGLQAFADARKKHYGAVATAAHLGKAPPAEEDDD